MQEYDRLKELVAAAEEDVIKAEGGNKAAGTLRTKVLEQRTEE